MSEQNERIKELEKIITLGRKVLDTATTSNKPNAVPEVKEEKFHTFRITALSWLNRVFDADHTCNQNFSNEVTTATVARTKRALGILQAARIELESEWLPTTKSNLAKDILSSMLRHAQREHGAGNIQAAAIISSSVVAELLRRICLKAGISLVNKQLQGKPAAKKALQLTGEAYKKKIFDRKINKLFITVIDLAEQQTALEAPQPRTREVEQAIASLMELIPTLPL